MDGGYSPPDYVLHGGQRAFIATGDSPYDDTSSPTESIRQKAEKLPTRIQDVIDDIALLAYGNYLQATKWENIRNIKGRATGTHQPSDFFFTRPESVNSDVQFGFEIGSVMNVLYQTAKGDPDWTDFLWGVILGFVGGKPGKEDMEAEALESLIDTIQDRSTARYHLSQREQSGVDFLLRQHEQRRDVVRTELEDHSITPTDTLVSKIRGRLQERGHPVTKETVQEFIKAEIEYSRLKLVDDIYQNVIADAESIDEKGFSTSKVEAMEMLKPVWELDSPKSQRVAEKAGYSSSASGLATGVLDRLSQTEGKELWTTYPIVEGDQGGWKMTTYGTVVGELLFESDAFQTETPLHERESPLEWVYEYGLDPNQVDEDRRMLIEKLRQEINPDDS
ncbi:hypothetical protein HSR122_2179 [Halapricum desulfuricans]|uniref:Uncharacterized protein n=1 Tax=Halapricum desulfuricans TaxID=2841257 RepID=A0A897N586_9EURY|nr:hypothetical protein HSR122_2179 [Halapricum desulfuricans]